MDIRLDGQVAIVTGAGQGLGKGRFPNPGHVLEKHVASGEKGGDQRINDLGLAANHAHDRFVQPFESLQNRV